METLLIKAVHAVSEKKLSFANNYTENEGKRIDEIPEEKLNNLTSSRIETTSEQEKDHTHKLEEDVKRLSNNYRLIQDLEIEGSVDKAEVRAVNIANLERGIEFLKEATQHIQKIIELGGIRNTIIIKKGANVKEVKMKAGNVGSSSDKAPEDPNVISRLGLFLPEDAMSFSRKLLKTAESLFKGDTRKCPL